MASLLRNWPSSFSEMAHELSKPHRGRVCLTVLAAALACACVADEAERIYLSALEGEDTGMSRVEQIDRITQAIALAPDRPQYYETRAIYRIDLRSFADALDDIDRAIVLGDRPYLRFLRGLVLCQSGRCGDALDEFNLAIQRQPANTQFYRGRGLALVDAHRFEEALRDGEHLMSDAPQMAESHYVRGVALQGLDRHVEAVRDLSEAIRIRPELIYPRLARSRSFDALGDNDKARADLASAAAMRGSHRGCALCEDPFRY